MVSIVRADENDSHLLLKIASQTFIESHGASAKPEDISLYMAKTYSNDILKEELLDTKNIYHIIYHNNHVAGYSKIILNSPYPNSPNKNITKLERLYLLKNFYNLKL